MDLATRTLLTGQNDRMTVGRRFAAALSVCAACVMASASVSRADGDPASDYLVARQVFVSSQQVAESPGQRMLLATVAAANRAGFSIRVAVISSDYDLGSITALWRRPALYARFLGLELAAAYRGRLLVAMPNGFGLFWSGRRTGSEDRVLRKVAIEPGETGLAHGAQTAVRRLATADGVSLPSAAQPSGPAAVPDDGSALLAEIAAGLVAFVVLAAGTLTLRRRVLVRRVRMREPARDSAVLGRRLRMAVAVPGFAAICVVAVGAPILVLRSGRHGSGSSGEQAGAVVTPPALTWPAGRRPVPNFTLSDQDGRSVSVDAYRGRPVIVTFVDPLCRNLCPLEAKVLNDAVSRMPASERPEILAVSVDVFAGANRRTNLRRDVRTWDLVRQWRWAVGRPSELTAVWRRYGVGVKVTTKEIAGTAIHYVTHTEAAYIVDASGHERALFLWPFYPQDVQRTLRALS